MTSTLLRQTEASDAELISAVRGGDVDAYGELFGRHVDAARRLARQMAPGAEADDLVSEAFVKVLDLLQRGLGPDVAFRAYLLTAVRRLQVDRIRAASRLQTTDDLAPFDPGIPFRDTAVEGFEAGAAARAFASLPERWQLVLWHTEVEGQRPAEVAPLLGMSPNAVSALAYRAREGLRQAYLDMHASQAVDAACDWTQRRLGGYVRQGLPRRETVKVEQHVTGCRRCAAVYLELSEVNSRLAALLAPALLGAGLAAAYVSASTAAVPSAASVVVGQARDFVGSHVPVVAGAAAVTVAGAAFVTLQLVQEPPSGPSEAAVLETVPDASPDPTRPDRPDGGSPAADRPVREAPVTLGLSAVGPPASEADQPGGPNGSADDPVDPGQDPTDPGEDPTDPGEDPTDPGEDPTDPGEDPTDPGEDPTDPGEDPTDPGEDPTDPGEDPTDPGEDPTGSDLGVTARATAGPGGTYEVTVTVTGLAPGEQASLTLAGEGLAQVLTSDARCDLGVRGGTCTVQAAPAAYTFKALAPPSRLATLSFRVSGDGTDPDPSNNATTVTLAS